ncbi:DUSAM domain-containing protein [Myxococcus sp. MISCRS1]|uniref:DUSAM domain-containing protein n=1 Tax=unclassified Myxococcus TaxID=2648731 RepID=UPI001CBC51BC|nr:DUSAM domain-containing protein [Myxococcus sp. MISCRS1]MBZ4395727.1 DUSAM domain-containing protein [Myxococcus sp. AS-1-15]MCY0998909.1 DUSAM domain-containing protein [Myxococcus sp. MISCRS1]
MSDELDWDPIRTLARRVLQGGEGLVLTDDIRTLLERTAREVGIGISEATDLLATDAGARTLLEECARRIREGSSRMVSSLNQRCRHKRAGDFDAARQVMRDVLAVERVPHYREVAQGQLDEMSDDP